MLKDGLLNPAINHLLSRVRHTNCLLISDSGFPTLPRIKTVDISLVADIPRVLEVLHAVRMNFQCCRAVMSAEFRDVQGPEVQRSYAEALQGVDITWVTHSEFKQKALHVIGIIRTGDTTRFGNVLLESS